MLRAVPCGLTVPTDERFRETVRAFSVRVTAYLGYAEGGARAIGQVVEQVVEGVTEYAFQGVAHEAIQINFATGARDMEICLRYRGSPDTRSGASAGRVECGRDEGAGFCRPDPPASRSGVGAGTWELPRYEALGTIA